VSLACSKIAAARCAEICKSVGKCTELLILGKCCAVRYLNCGINVVNVDNVSKLGNLAVCNDINLVLKGKGTFVSDLDVANLNVTGLPVSVIKDCAGGSICPVGICGWNSLLSISPIHLNVKFTGLDDVTGACNGIGEPSKRCTDKHSEAHTESNYACD